LRSSPAIASNWRNVTEEMACEIAGEQTDRRSECSIWSIQRGQHTYSTL